VLGGIDRLLQLALDVHVSSNLWTIMANSVMRRLRRCERAMDILELVTF